MVKPDGIEIELAQAIPQRGECMRDLANHLPLIQIKPQFDRGRSAGRSRGCDQRAHPHEPRSGRRSQNEKEKEMTAIRPRFCPPYADDRKYSFVSSYSIS